MRHNNDLHIAHGNHANCLPNAQSDTGYHTTVQALDPILGVDVGQGVPDSHLRRSVGVHSLALHLDADDLDGLVPRAETTTQTGCENLLPRAQLGVFLLPGSPADALLCQTAETETRSPVRHLADGDGVDSLVDALDALLPVDVHEGGKGALGRDTCCSQLRLGDLDGLHAGAETHGRICLRNTTHDTSTDTSSEITGTEGACVVFGFGGHEEEDGALGGCFNPGPGDETLVDCCTEGID